MKSSLDTCQLSIYLPLEMVRSMMLVPRGELNVIVLPTFSIDRLFLAMKSRIISPRESSLKPHTFEWVFESIPMSRPWPPMLDLVTVRSRASGMSVMLPSQYELVMYVFFLPMYPTQVI